MIYSDELLKDIHKLKFPSIIEREFQELYYNHKAVHFIHTFGVIPAFVILCAYWVGDFFGFSQLTNEHIIARALGIVPLPIMWLCRKNEFYKKYARNIASLYLFELALTVLYLVIISPHTDFAHRGYVMSFPMVIFIMFLAKPKVSVALIFSTLFTLIHTCCSLILDIKPLGFSEAISHIHIDLTMVSSIIIGAVTCHQLEVAERRDFVQRRIIEQEREQILLQKLELDDSLKTIESNVLQLQEKNLQLDQLNKEKNEFLGIAAHDLKNPLAGIALQIGNVKRYLSRMTPQDIIKAMDSVESTTVRMKDIVMNLLDVNAIESGVTNATISAFPVQPLLEQIFEEYKQKAAQKNISVTLQANSHSLVALADKMMLHQVLDNLVSNAIKFTHSGKNVFLQAKSIQGNQIIEIRVIDEGQGISEDELPKLFGKFVKLQARPTAGESSTGLGLSIVKKLVQSMNGTIRCESHLHIGSEFIVEIPAQELQQQHSFVTNRHSESSIQQTTT